MGKRRLGCIATFGLVSAILVVGNLAKAGRPTGPEALADLVLGLSGFLGILVALIGFDEFFSAGGDEPPLAPVETIRSFLKNNEGRFLLALALLWLGCAAVLFRSILH
jgi:hypothetical protein